MSLTTREVRQSRAVRSRWRRSGAILGLAALTTVAVLALPASGVDVATFSNPTALTIADATYSGGVTTSGEASLYPSPITVTGASGTITDVNVTLTGLVHPVADDLDVMLVSPTGESLVVLAEPGITSPSSSTLTSVNGNYTFDDSAATAFPNANPSLGVPVASGSYQPTNNNLAGPDKFPAPAPTPGGATTLATFDGESANGVWSLYVVDDADGDIGSLNGGWSLQVSTTGPTTTTSSTTTTTTAAPALIVPGVASIHRSSASGTQILSVPVSLQDDHGQPVSSSVPVSVDYSTGDYNAQSPADYAVTSGTLTWPAGDSTSRYVNVSIPATSVASDPKVFLVRLQNVIGANPTIGGIGLGLGVIYDDNPSVTIQLHDASVSVPAGGHGTLVFHASLTNTSNQLTAIHYTPTDGTAHAGTDYKALSGTMLIAPGATADRLFYVPVTGVGPSGSTRTFTLTLSAPGGPLSIFGTGAATGTIHVS